MTHAKMLGRSRHTEPRCPYGCCGPHDRQSKRIDRRLARHREARAWKADR